MLKCPSHGVALVPMQSNSGCLLYLGCPVTGCKRARAWKSGPKNRKRPSPEAVKWNDYVDRKMAELENRK